MGIGLASVSLAAGPTRELPPLNKAVIEYARGRLGTSVGDGTCARLAAEALREAGAARFYQGPEGEAGWGRPVASFAEALPGDVLEFRDAVFEGRRSLGGGGAVTYRQEFPHHVAIVSGARGRGREVLLLHQNVEVRSVKSRTVKKGVIRPADLREGGKVLIYRPVPSEDDRPTSPTERRPQP